jgi:alpha-beta hydrolase superfamily lysophospholipase
MLQEIFLKNHIDLDINIIEGQNLKNIKAIIIHVHGVGSHFQPVYHSLDEFDERDNFFSRFGYKSFALEFHGHGKSQGLKCAINSFDDLVNDLDIIVKYVSKKYSYPIYLFGESMGCAVIFKYCITKMNNIRGVIFLSPLCGIDKNLKPNKVLKNILLGLSNIAPNLQLVSTTKNMAKKSTLNNEYLLAKNNNQYFYKDSHRLCTGRELLHVSEWIDENCHLFSKPILFFHGDKDSITDPEITKDVFNKISSTDKQLFMIKEGYHILLLDNYKDSIIPEYILTKTINWLDKNIEKNTL